MLTLCWMDEDHCLRTMTGESYSKILRRKAVRLRVDWVASVVMTIGRRCPPLHQRKSDVLGGTDSWAGDLKAGEESAAPLQPWFITATSGGTQTPRSSGHSPQQSLSSRRSSKKLRQTSAAKSFAPSRPTLGKDAKFVSSLTAVIPITH